ncbi:hypothetical protein NKG05_01090 [Oerskovia sp. M15]
MGVALGPLVGGAVVEGMSWEAIFWINVPVALVAVPLVFVALRESFGRRGPIDLVGLALAGTGVFAGVWGIIRGNEDGWTSAVVLSLLAGSVLLLAAFVAWERRLAQRGGSPLVPCACSARAASRSRTCPASRSRSGCSARCSSSSSTSRSPRVSHRSTPASARFRGPRPHAGRARRGHARAAPGNPHAARDGPDGPDPLAGLARARLVERDVRRARPGLRARGIGMG